MKAYNAMKTYGAKNYGDTKMEDHGSNAPYITELSRYEKRTAMELSPWKPGFTRVIFSNVNAISQRAIELPTNLYRSVDGRSLAEFERLFDTGLVRKAPACFTDFYTRGRVTVGQAESGRPLLAWEIAEWSESKSLQAYWRDSRLDD